MRKPPVKHMRIAFIPWSRVLEQERKAVSEASPMVAAQLVVNLISGLREEEDRSYTAHIAKWQIRMQSISVRKKRATIEKMPLQ